jgi:hypothetical protein
MAIRERLITELEGFQVGAQADDTALVVMRRAHESSMIQAAAATSDAALRV